MKAGNDISTFENDFDNFRGGIYYIHSVYCVCLTARDTDKAFIIILAK